MLRKQIIMPLVAALAGSAWGGIFLPVTALAACTTANNVTACTGATNLGATIGNGPDGPDNRTVIVTDGATVTTGDRAAISLRDGAVITIEENASVTNRHQDRQDVYAGCW